jgi:hypothetical protein
MKLQKSSFLATLSQVRKKTTVIKNTLLGVFTKLDLRNVLYCKKRCIDTQAHTCIHVRKHNHTQNQTHDLEKYLSLGSASFYGNVIM